jgi:hypothetical protein
VPGVVPGCTTTGTWSSSTQLGRHLALDRPDPARPLHRGHLPDLCGYGEARGDQCDNCGNQLDPIDLINPRSKINGETPEFIETQHFFLDLPALAESLRSGSARARGDSGTGVPT